MIYLELFWTYFKIGLFTIGGGYAMIPLINQLIVGKYISYELMLDFMAISESTPGPFAVNLATFVGMEAGAVNGIIGSYFGAFMATLGVVLPSFLIVLIISVLLQKFNKSNALNKIIYGIRPVVVGLIASAFLTILCGLILPKLKLTGFASMDFGDFDYISLILAVLFFGLSFIKVKGKKLHPIILISSSAVVGIVLYGVFKL